MQAQILAPAAVLVAWSIIVLIWVAATRLPAISKMGGLANAKAGGRGQDLEGVLPDNVQWKSHNYTHLMEQPTLFYAVVVILAIMGPHPHDVLFAWIYVGLRIVHSLWQSTVNKLPVRFSLFLLYTLALALLTAHAVKLTLFAA